MKQVTLIECNDNTAFLTFWNATFLVIEINVHKICCVKLLEKNIRRIVFLTLVSLFDNININILHSTIITLKFELMWIKKVQTPSYFPHLTLYVVCSELIKFHHVVLFCCFCKYTFNNLIFQPLSWCLPELF